VTDLRSEDDRVQQAVPAVLERELRVVREAIAMVAAGNAPRVTIAGLRFGETILAPARELALESGVTITPLWRGDEAGVDLSIEAVGS
jgi:hypothetical protein